MRYIDLQGPQGNAILLWGVAIDIARQTKANIFGFDPIHQKEFIYQKFQTMPYEDTVKFIRDNYSSFITLSGGEDDWDGDDDWEDEDEEL